MDATNLQDKLAEALLITGSLGRSGSSTATI